MLDKFDDRYTLTPDDISSILLKRHAAPLALSLYILFVGSLKIDKVPHKWKTGFVISVHKVIYKVVVSNCRPMSLTFILRKLFGKLHREEMSIVIKISLLNKCQPEFANIGLH